MFKRINETMIVGFLLCLFVFTVVFLSGCPSGEPEPCVPEYCSDDDDSASDDDDSSVSDDDDSGE